jgi:tyrosyl-DNA phosphodiesterase 1
MVMRRVVNIQLVNSINHMFNLMAVAQVSLHRPRTEQWGTHHTKAFVLVYERGVRVIVHTANLIFIDCNDKTQAIWWQDFPRTSGHDKPSQSPEKGNDFGATLIRYLRALKLPRAEWEALHAALDSVDFSGARVALVPSTPGRHFGTDMADQGHLRVRALLQKAEFSGRFRGTPIVCQCSSLGSLSEKWLSDLQQSFAAGQCESAGPTGICFLRLLLESFLRLLLSCYPPQGLLP